MVKGPLADGFHTIAEGDGFKVVTTGKGTVTDGFHAIGNFDGSKGVTIVKGIASDGGYPVFDYYSCDILSPVGNRAVICHPAITGNGQGCTIQTPGTIAGSATSNR